MHVGARHQQRHFSLVFGVQYTCDNGSGKEFYEILAKAGTRAPRRKANALDPRLRLGAAMMATTAPPRPRHGATASL
jgi:hypothetical protein